MADILVIDDEALLRQFIRDILVVGGHTVREVWDGAAGLRAIAASRPDLVLCDIYMPGQEGIRTILDLKVVAPGLPVVAISGGDRTGDRSALDYATVLGAVAALTKPFSPDVLLGVVDGILTGRRPEGPTCDRVGYPGDGRQICPLVGSCPHVGESISCGILPVLPMRRRPAEVVV